jgi:hypothetical protein
LNPIGDKRRQQSCIVVDCDSDVDVNQFGTNYIPHAYEPNYECTIGRREMVWVHYHILHHVHARVYTWKTEKMLHQSSTNHQDIKRNKSFEFWSGCCIDCDTN